MPEPPNQQNREKKPIPEISKPALYFVLIIALFGIARFVSIQIENAQTTLKKLSDTALQEKAPKFIAKNPSAPASSSSTSITLLSPNGGEVLTAGKYYQIKWSYNLTAKDLKGYFAEIYVRQDQHRQCKIPSPGMIPIDAGVLNWRLEPDFFLPSENDYRVTISLIAPGDRTLAEDQSDKPFTIVGGQAPSCALF